LKLVKSVKNEKFLQNNAGNQNPTFPTNKKIVFKNTTCLKLK